MDDTASGARADALAQPTRARLFALLRDMGRPATTAELAERLGLHVNGVRAHLERMLEAQLVTRTPIRHGRGRPRDTWAVAPAARAAAAPERYEELGRWLARVLGSGRRGPSGIEASGREIGREIARPAGPDTRAALQENLGALGFEPELTATGDSATLSICLRNCPYRAAVHESPTAICTLHRGITRGVLDVIAPGARLTNFVPADPDRAGCTLEVRNLPAG